jgi:two-component system LytT family response regulator
MNHQKRFSEKTNPYHEAQKIVRVQAIKNYSKIYYINGNTYVVCRTLQLMQDALPETDFVRVHRSHLINRQFIIGISGEQKNELRLSNGETIQMSRRQKFQFVAR